MSWVGVAGAAQEAQGGVGAYLLKGRAWGVGTGQWAARADDLASL